MSLFCLYDVVAEDFGPTFEAHTDGEAVRKVRALAEKQKIRPEDFLLYRVGDIQRESKFCKVVGYDMEAIAWKEEEVQE